MASNVESWVLLSLALFTIIVRVFVRWKLVGPSNFQLDDYLMPLAGVCSFLGLPRVFVCAKTISAQIVFILETVAAYLVVANYQGLTNSYMTDQQRKEINPDSKEWYNRVAGSKIQIIGWSLYTAILWLVKFSLAVFYSRLTYVHHKSAAETREAL